MNQIANIGATPRLVVQRPIMQANIDRMAAAARAGGRNVRPHFKTSKMIEVAQRQIAAGAIGMTCATVGELEALVAAGITDLFWAYEPVGEVNVAAVLDLARRADLKIGIDSMAVARPLSEAAVQAGISLTYLMEIDSGMHRAGVAPEAAAKLHAELRQLPGLTLAGIFTHEGHLYGIPDLTARAEAGRALGAAMAGIAATLRATGSACTTVSVGSTPAAASAPFVEGVTELRPGTYVFNDDNQTFLDVCTHDQCAVTVMSRVISRPRPGAAIIDAGLKAMSSDKSLRSSRFGTVAGMPDIAFETAYEEHGLLTGPGADRLSVGDLLAIVPNHVCGAVNMWSSALVADGARIEDEWAIVGRH